MPQRRRLHEEGGIRAHFAAERETLQQAESDHEQGRGDSDGRVGRNQRQSDHGDAHQPERQQHRRLAAGAIRVSTDDQRAQRPGEETGAKGGE